MTMHPSLPALIAAATLVACGGSSSTHPAAELTIGPPPATTLQASTGALGLMVSGKARHIVITNTGEHPALGLTVAGREALPAGTQLDSDCDTLDPGMSCTLMVTPGAAPSAAPADKNALGVAVTLTGSNTIPLALAVHVLNIGSVYQGGYVFDIDDTTPGSGSVGGKALGLEVHEHPWSAAPWELGPSGYVVPGARSATDGKTNTRAIVEHMSQLQPPLDPSTYGAGACDGSTEGGQTGWYLPAICELGYDAQGAFTDLCGTKDQPLLPANVKSRLLDNHKVLLGVRNLYSSTELEAPQELTMWFLQEDWLPNGELYSGISPMAKLYGDPYACMRTLTP